MKKSHVIQVEGIGAVNYVENPRARKITITIRPHHGVRVAIPPHADLEAAMDFVRRKDAWIKKHLATIRAHKKEKEEANNTFLNIDKKEARKKITGRLAELARQHGFTYGKVAIRNQKTRWGSCAANGNISLNMKLVMLPQELFDYVIFHELVHTRVHNHSRKFWEELGKYVENGKAKARTLTEWGMGIL